MLVTVFFCFNSNLLCIDKNFQNELWVLQSSRQDCPVRGLEGRNFRWCCTGCNTRNKPGGCPAECAAPWGFVVRPDAVFDDPGQLRGIVFPVGRGVFKTTAFA